MRANHLRECLAGLLSFGLAAVACLPAGAALADGVSCSGHGISPEHKIEAAEPIRVTVTVDGEELTTKADLGFRCIGGDRGFPGHGRGS